MSDLMKRLTLMQQEYNGADCVRCRDRVQTLEADLREVRHEYESCMDRDSSSGSVIADYQQQIKGLEADLAMNAALLARQCDLARQAETERDIARNESEENKLEWYAAIKAMREGLDRIQALEAERDMARDSLQIVSEAGGRQLQRGNRLEAALRMWVIALDGLTAKMIDPKYLQGELAQAKRALAGEGDK
jgi:chromosome segregation ATPase